MKLSFRKVYNKIGYRQTVEFLTDDVKRCGGSATEIVNMYGNLIMLTVTSNKKLNRKLEVVNCGTTLIHQDISEFEAWAYSLQDIK